MYRGTIDGLQAGLFAILIIFLLMGFSEHISIKPIDNQTSTNSLLNNKESDSLYGTKIGSVEALITKIDQGIFSTIITKEVVLSGVHYRLPYQLSTEFNNKLKQGDRIKIEYLKENNTIRTITTGDLQD